MNRTRAEIDPVRVRLGLMAAGIAVALLGLDRLLQGIAFWMGYGASVWGAGGWSRWIEQSTAEQKDQVVQDWTPIALEPLAGACVVALGVWLFRSRSAVRMALGVGRRRT